MGTKKLVFVCALILASISVTAQTPAVSAAEKHGEQHGADVWSKEGFAAIASVIATAVSVFIAVWTIYQKKKTDTKLALLNEKIANRMADYDSVIKERLSQQQARLEYEYEARKRLYQEWEPLAFQLIENSDNAFHRIQSIARTARINQLNNYSFLGHFGYYFISTVYQLFYPLAIFRRMQNKITSVDLKLDKKIQIQYSLIKQVYLSWTDDFIFAKQLGLDYRPNEENWEALRQENEAIYWRQGLPMGLVDIVIDLLFTPDKTRLLSYGEFELLVSTNAEAIKQIDVIRDILTGFNPEKRPVLWQLLLSQSLLYKKLLRVNEIQNEEISKNEISTFQLEPAEMETLYTNSTVDSNGFEVKINLAGNYIDRQLKFI